MPTEREILEILEPGEIDLTPLEIRDIRLLPEGRGGPDFALRFKWEEWSDWFVGEVTASSTPKSIAAALAVAKRYAGADAWPLVIAPYLSPEALQRCLGEAVSAVDLCGNAVVLVPGRVSVFRTGMPNQYPASRYIKSIYRGKSSLVPRAFLLRSGFERVGDIREEILRRGGEISLGTVSKVLKGLDEDLVVRKEPNIEVLQPDVLLDRLSEDYAADRVAPSASAEVKLDPSPKNLRDLRRDCEDQGLMCVAASIGPDDPVPESGPPSIFVEKLDRVLEALELEPVPRFGGMRLLEASDLRVYWDRREIKGFYWSSPIQRYLELASGGKREKELSGLLKDRILGEATGG